MIDFKGKRICFIAPSFFGYELEIKSKLESLGSIVDYFDERPNNDFLTRSLIRINKKILFKKINSYFFEILNNIKQRSYDLFFFVNVESVSISIIEKFKETNPTSKFILYMWDSLKNKPNTQNVLSLFDYCYTFDKSDAEEYNLEFCPLFYIDAYSNSINVNAKYDISFIGTAHSDRCLLVKNVISAIGNNKSFVYFYQFNRFMFFFYKLFSDRFEGVSIDEISFIALSRDNVVNVIKSSKMIIDINHPKQQGLTMRTIEVLGAKRKLITTNYHVKDYDFYNECNILVIDRQNPIIPLDFVYSSYSEIPVHIYDKYSIENWLRCVFK